MNICRNVKKIATFFVLEYDSVSVQRAIRHVAPCTLTLDKIKTEKMQHMNICRNVKKIATFFVLEYDSVSVQRAIRHVAPCTLTLDKIKTEKMQRYLRKGE